MPVDVPVINCFIKFINDLVNAFMKITPLVGKIIYPVILNFFNVVSCQLPNACRILRKLFAGEITDQDLVAVKIMLWLIRECIGWATSVPFLFQSDKIEVNMNIISIFLLAQSI